MTPDLKEIVKWINIDMGINTEHDTGDKHITTLINALVEERTKVMELRFFADHPVKIEESNRTPLLHLHCGPCSAANKPDPRHKWTDNQWRTQALRELGLEGVWSMKESL